MELIATITGFAAVTCLVALMGILWDFAERADGGAMSAEGPGRKAAQK